MYDYNGELFPSMSEMQRMNCINGGMYQHQISYLNQIIYNLQKENEMLKNNKSYIDNSLDKEKYVFIPNKRTLDLKTGLYKE